MRSPSHHRGQLLDRCGLVLQPSVLVEGSAMRGVRIDDPEHTTIRPNTSSILAFHMDRQEQLYSCLGCGRCIEACRQDSIPASSTAASPPATSRRPSPWASPAASAAPAAATSALPVWIWRTASSRPRRSLSPSRNSLPDKRRSFTVVSITSPYAVYPAP